MSTRVVERFYEAMKDVLPELLLEKSDREKYAVARARKVLPTFELIIELVDYLPSDIAYDVIRAKEGTINYGWEMDAYIYALKKFDTEEAKEMRRQRRKEELKQKMALSMEMDEQKGE